MLLIEIVGLKERLLFGRFFDQSDCSTFLDYIGTKGVFPINGLHDLVSIYGFFRDCDQPGPIEMLESHQDLFISGCTRIRLPVWNVSFLQEGLAFRVLTIAA